MKRLSYLAIAIVLVLSQIAARLVSPATFTVRSTVGVGRQARYGQAIKSGLADITNTLPVGSHDASSGMQNQFSCSPKGAPTYPKNQSVPFMRPFLPAAYHVP